MANGNVLLALQAVLSTIFQPVFSTIWHLTVSPPSLII